MIIPDSIEIIDSHTGGEPTRVVVGGWPEPQGDTMSQRRDYMRAHHELLRRAVVCEPRGHNAIIGALLTEPVNEGSCSGVIFFNDVGYLEMCGHGLIGLVETLRFMGKLDSGIVHIDTSVGVVSATVDDEGMVTIANVPSYVHKEDVKITVPGVGDVCGDVAYGGNWFFMVASPKPQLAMSNLDTLMIQTKAIRQSLIDEGITGKEGAIVDHIEYFGEPTVAGAHSKNFVLCPGSAYDRSPCGTGTSAKMACLHNKGLLAIGQRWVQESITGSVFQGWLEQKDGVLLPFIRACANVVSKATLYFDPKDQFCWGID